MLYLSLGSNLGDRAANLRKAVIRIGEEIGTVMDMSDVFETEPWGFVSRHAFMNQAVSVETTLPPEEILQRTQRIEREMGRSGKSTEGVYHDRIIDIDILLYDDMIIDMEDLKVPHPLMADRRFVLEPLAQIAPEIIHPASGMTVEELLKKL